MADRLYVNNYRTATTVALTDSGTSMTVASVTGIPSISGGDWIILTLTNGVQSEIVKATALTVNTFTIDRAEESTTARAWPVGTTVHLSATAASWDSISGGSPGGSDTQVQYNSGGSFAGHSGLTYDGAGVITSNAGAVFGGNATAAGYFRLMEDSDNGTSYTGFQSPAALGGNVMYTLPTADGTSGYVLTTNGSGTLSWASAGGVTGTSNQIDVTAGVVSLIADGTLPGAGGWHMSVGGTGSRGSNSVGRFRYNTSTGYVEFNDSSGWFNLLSTYAVTGTGNAVQATSPTLVTPILGVAAATSIDFGQDPLNYYEVGTFTPTFTFVTPGDLSVSYAIQSGTYTRIGDVVFFSYTLRCTPTFTTASGAATFGGLPFNIASSGNWRFMSSISESTTYPSGVTSTFASGTGSSATFIIEGQGSATASTSFTTAHFTSTVQRTVVVSGMYKI